MQVSVLALAAFSPASPVDLRKEIANCPMFSTGSKGNLHRSRRTVAHSLKDFALAGCHFAPPLMSVLSGNHMRQVPIFFTAKPPMPHFWATWVST